MLHSFKDCPRQSFPGQILLGFFVKNASAHDCSFTFRFKWKLREICLHFAGLFRWPEQNPVALKKALSKKDLGIAYESDKIFFFF